MGLVPEHILDRRRALSERFLEGDGIEIGALHEPLGVGERASVRYVDRLPVPDLRRHYPELEAYDLVDVDLVDDGEVLSTIGDGQLDFLIANHMLEHTENPIGTIRHHLRTLRPGGILYYAIPDKRFSFDVDRPLTTFEHLVRDDEQGPQISRLDHYREWVRLVSKVTAPAEYEEQVEALMRIGYSIHFHVWVEETFLDFLRETKRRLGGAFEVEHAERNDTEVIVILRKP